jgi:hypothetical protein
MFLYLIIAPSRCRGLGARFQASSRLSRMRIQGIGLTNAWHLVLVDMSFGTIPDQPFQYNIIEVTVLGQGGWQLSGYEGLAFRCTKFKVG